MLIAGSSQNSNVYLEILAQNAKINLFRYQILLPYFPATFAILGAEVEFSFLILIFIQHG